MPTPHQEKRQKSQTKVACQQLEPKFFASPDPRY